MTIFDQPGVTAVALWTGVHLLLTLALALNVTRLRFASARGDVDDARRRWTELLPRLLEADPLKAEVRAALESL